MKKTKIITSIIIMFISWVILGRYIAAIVHGEHIGVGTWLPVVACAIIWTFLSYKFLKRD